jgi:hypothetical protein
MGKVAYIGVRERPRTYMETLISACTAAEAASAARRNRS